MTLTAVEVWLPIKVCEIAAVHGQRCKGSPELYTPHQEGGGTTQMLNLVGM